MPSQSIQTEEKTIASDVNATTAQYDTEGQNQEEERSFEAEGQKGVTESEGIGGDSECSRIWQPKRSVG